MLCTFEVFNVWTLSKRAFGGKRVEMILLYLFRYTLAWHTTGSIAYLPEILSDFWIGALPGCRSDRKI